MNPEQKLEITHIDPERLMPAEYNPRKMDGPEFRRLRRGIQNYGIVDPLVAKAEDYLLIGGHQRLRAAKELEMETVPVVLLEGLDEQETAALNVLLNNPQAQGEFDMGKLVEILSDLDANGFDATLTGFDEGELEEMLAPENLPGSEPEPEYPFSEELMEEHQYVVLYFDNSLDWQVAQDLLGLETVKAWDAREGYERKGIGRVIRGDEVLQMIQGVPGAEESDGD